MGNMERETNGTGKPPDEQGIRLGTHFVGTNLSNLSRAHRELVRESPEMARTLAGFRKALDRLVKQHHAQPQVRGMGAPEDLLRQLRTPAFRRHAWKLGRAARALKEEVKRLQGRVPEDAAQKLRNNTQAILVSIDEISKAARPPRKPIPPAATGEARPATARGLFRRLAGRLFGRHK